MTTSFRFGATISLDGTDDPVVIVRFTGRAQDAEFKAYLKELERMMFRRTDRLAMLLDARGAGLSPPTQRTMQAEWLKAHALMIRQRSVGMAFVVSSALVRGTMTAVFWLQPLPVPHHVVSTEADARAWCEAQLARAAKTHSVRPQPRLE